MLPHLELRMVRFLVLAQYAPAEIRYCTHNRPPVPQLPEHHLPPELSTYSPHDDVIVYLRHGLFLSPLIPNDICIIAVSYLYLDCILLISVIRYYTVRPSLKLVDFACPGNLCRGVSSTGSVQALVVKSESDPSPSRFLFLPFPDRNPTLPGVFP